MLTRYAVLSGVGAMMAVAACAVVTPQAWAGGGVSCPPGEIPDPRTGTCIIRVVLPPVQPISGPPARPGPKPQPPGKPPKCTNPTGQAIPCDAGGGYWSPDRQCYVKVAHPQPPRSDPVWLGNTMGTIYQCDSPTDRYFFWSATQPTGPTAPPDPVQLAQVAVTAMRLKAVTIGIVPLNRPGSVGLVGMPQWMWVQNPSASTWGPITKSASAGGYTVTATGRVGRILWDMGDGQTVTCGEGTPYSMADGVARSPSCGHDGYTRQGTYTVTATSSWTVSWAGIGQTGSIPVTLRQTTTVQIGEAQVLTQ